MADIIKEADEGLTFAAFLLTPTIKGICCYIYNSLKMVARNSELQHPIEVDLMFGKTYVTFVVCDRL